MFPDFQEVSTPVSDGLLCAFAQSSTLSQPMSYPLWSHGGHEYIYRHSFFHPLIARDCFHYFASAGNVGSTRLVKIANGRALKILQFSAQEKIKSSSDIFCHRIPTQSLGK